MSQELVRISSFQELRADLIKQYEEKRNLWFTASEAAGDKPDKKTLTLLLALMDDMQTVKEEIHALECSHIEKTVVPHLRPLILKKEREFQVWVKNKSHAGWAEIEEMRKKGASFKEIDAKVQSGRLESLSGLIRESEITLDDIILRPVGYWLSPVIDYDKMKEIGIEEFVTQNSYLIYELKEQT